MRPRPTSNGAPSTRTSGASPLDGAIASTRAPPDQRRPKRSSAAIASLASGMESSRWMSCDRKPRMPARPSASVTRSIRVRQPRPAALVVARRSLHRDLEVELGQPPQLLGQDCGLPRALRGQGDVRELSPADAAGTAAGHADSTRSGDASRISTASARQNLAVSPASVRRARTRSPGSVCRTKITRPSCRATQCPPWATGPISSSTRSSERSSADSSSHAERYPGRLSSPVCPSEDASCHGTEATTTPGREQQPALEPQRALVVQQVLPPVPDHVLGDVDARPRRAATRGGSAHVR